MINNSIDYSKLENVIFKKAYKLSEVKDRLEVVAFDIVKFKDDDEGSRLWQVQSADDGDYIVALYSEETKKEGSHWDVTISKTSSDVQISYKGDPLVRLPVSKLGIPRTELNQVESYLPSKLAENKKLVKALLNELNEATRKQVLQKYPELA